MDDQHALLLDAVNELRRAGMGGAGCAQIRALLDIVIRYTLLHRACEERLMARWCFPGLIEHREQHRQILERLDRAALGFRRERGFAIAPPLTPLCQSFVDHICNADREYGQWLNERNLR